MIKKYATLAMLVATGTLAAKIPLVRKPLIKDNVLESLNNAQEMNGLRSNVPVVDYSNTQYFVEVEVGTPG